MGLLAAPFGLAKAAPVAPTRTIYSGRIFPLIGEVPLWRAKQLSRYDDAQTEKQVLSACMAGFIEPLKD